MVGDFLKRLPPPLKNFMFFRLSEFWLKSVSSVSAILKNHKVFAELFSKRDPIEADLSIAEIS